MSSKDIARRVLKAESEAIAAALERIGASFDRAVNILLETSGQIIVTGMGKSGLIGRKIAATMTSTGSSSLFLHPAEATHGDLGIIRPADSVIALSTSGETEELIRLLAFIKRLGIKIIALAGNEHSTLARESDVFLDCGVAQEACQIGLVPTSSTTVTLAMGDALAIALMEKKGFNEQDFLHNHPGGSIGKKLLKVKHLMHQGAENLPLAFEDTGMQEAIRIINEKKFGLLVVRSREGQLKGIITDGDLRRAFLKGIDFNSARAADCMSSNPKTISPEALAVEALKIMEDNAITSLIVTGSGRKLLGLLHLHDLWRTEMI